MARFTEWCPELEAELRKPFPDDAWEDLELPVKGGRKVKIPYVPWWRYADRLDDLVGPQGWSIGEARWTVFGTPARLVMSVPVAILGVWKCQVGEDEIERLDKDTGDVEPIEGYGGPGQRAFAQGFKRSCAMFGLGRRETYDKSRRGKTRAQARDSKPADDGPKPAAPWQRKKIERLARERDLSPDQRVALDTRLDGTLSYAKANEIINHLKSLPKTASGEG